VSPTLAGFIARTMQLQGATIGEKASQESLEEFSNECAKRILRPDEPALETLKMQIAVEEANVLHARSARKATRDREERAEKMENEIVHTVVEGAPDEVVLLDRLYRAVFRYACVAAGLQCPNAPNPEPYTLHPETPKPLNRQTP
jgi:hypothetical protein